MRLHSFANADAAAREAALVIAGSARASIAARGRFLLAVSGGRTPALMLQFLAKQDLDWQKLHLFQVDERVAPDGHPDRNFREVQERLLTTAPLPSQRVYPMPITERDLDRGAADYGALLEALAGTPPVLDLVHLGLGSDGHTASLLPGDPALEVNTRDVTMTGVYQGRQRMTLTYPLLNRARHVLWLVTGAEKGPMLERLLAGDTSIPAGRIQRDNATIVADNAAAGQ